MLLKHIYNANQLRLLQINSTRLQIVNTFLINILNNLEYVLPHELPSADINLILGLERPDLALNLLCYLNPLQHLAVEEFALWAVVAVRCSC